MLNWLANEYGNPPIFITENGFSDYGGLNDTNRVLYYTVSTSTSCKYLECASSDSDAVRYVILRKLTDYIPTTFCNHTPIRKPYVLVRHFIVLYCVTFWQKQLVKSCTMVNICYKIVRSTVFYRTFH
jgi:Beta-glucosidase/6-phospho-beta-glucosidase/beta-galactosidase